ncbi:MAG: DUF937 domain-containing protein [Planctomycetota bacterium]
MNLMDLVKGAVGKQIMGQLGGMLGVDEEKASSAFDIGASSILGGMVNKASSPEGAQQVFEMAKGADTSILGKLGDILGSGGDDLDSLQKSGSGMLDGLLGANSQSGMVGAISKFLGLDESVMGKLLTLVAPILMGVIGKQVSASGLDVNGFSSLLSDQKEHLAGSLPGPLAQNLGFGDLMSSVSGAGQKAMEDATSAASGLDQIARATGGKVSAAADEATTPTEAVLGAGAAASSGLGAIKFLIPIALVALLAYLGWTYLGGGGEENGNQEQNNNQQLTVPGMDLDGLDLSPLGATGTKLTKGFSDITSGFEGLNDSGEDGAQKLSETITNFSGSVGEMGLGDLPAAGKTAASSLIGKFIETIKSLLGNQSEAIQQILKPAVDGLLEKLSPFTT